MSRWAGAAPAVDFYYFEDSYGKTVIVCGNSNPPLTYQGESLHSWEKLAFLLWKDQPRKVGNIHIIQPHERIIRGKGYKDAMRFMRMLTLDLDHGND